MAVGPELMLFHQRMIMLQIVDTQWKDHLYALDHLKEGIGLRGYGQRDPLVEYKKESFDMFQALMDRIDEEILRWIFLYQAMPASSSRTTTAVAPLRPAHAEPTRAQGARPAEATCRAGPRARARLGRGSRHVPQPQLQRPERGAVRLRPSRAEGVAGGRRRGPDRAPRRARRWDATIPALRQRPASTRSAMARTRPWLRLIASVVSVISAADL